MKTYTVSLRKMRHEGAPVLRYFLGELCISDWVGRRIRLEHTGTKQCIHCGRDIKKTFQQGYCFPCFRSLARCDSCIVRPDRCHYQRGTCREPEWGERNCLVDHVVYLANTTNLKVGVTGAHKLLERWGDQGATSALILARTPERRIAGLIETELSRYVKDRTDWRALLRGESTTEDLLAERERLLAYLPADFRRWIVNGEGAGEIYTLEYPVKSYAESPKSADLDKCASLEGELRGIRGQYLLVENEGLNIRKFAGYEVELSVLE